MKNLKKVLAFVVVFAMMFTMAVSASPFADVSDDASYAESVTVLNALSLMVGDDQGNFNPDQTITRAEAATVIVRAKGLGDAAAGAVGPTAFTDVPADHWASGFINIATQSGIVAGYGDGTFGPSDPVTYEQMVKLIVAALGYTPKADVNGGYPTGYLVIASQKNITKGATGNAGDPAPRKTVARLVYNALDVNMMEQTVFVKGAEEYAECNPARYLLNDLGIDKYEGVITSTYATKGGTVKNTDKTITMNYFTFNGEKENDDVTFDSYGKTNAADYLGYYVTAYAEEDEVTDDYTILAIAPKSGKNTVIELDYSQLDAYDGNTIDYFVNPSDKNSVSADLAGNVKFYYNGTQDKASAEKFIDDSIDDTKIVTGKVKLLSNGTSSDDYNYVFVTQYTKNLVVTEINAPKKIAYGKDGGKIDFDDETVIYTIYKDGAVASFNDIKVGDILTVAANVAGDVQAVFICDKTVEGTVSEKTSDDDAYFKINGNLYRVDPDDGPAIKVGDNGLFYLNVDDRIVAKDAQRGKSAGVYAYAINAAVDTSLSGDKVEIKYLTSEGKWETNYLASKVNVYKGDNSTPAVEAAKDGIAGFFEGGALIPQLFKFTTNSSGEIKNVYLAAKNDEDNFSEDKYGVDIAYSAVSDKLSNVFVEDKTIVFNVPEEGVVSTAEKDFSVSTAKATFSDGSTYTFRAYDVDEYPEVMVVYGAATAIDPSTRVLVLTSVAKGRNENEIEVTKFYGYQEGESVTANASEDGVEYYDIEGDPIADPGLGAGDAVIFSLDGAGDIDKIQLLFKAEDAAITNPFYLFADKLDADGYVANYYGPAVKRASGGKLTIDLDGIADDEEVRTLKGNYNVYEVNVNRKTPIVNVSDYASIDASKDVKAGKSIDMVYLRYYDESVVDVVVYTFIIDYDYQYAGQNA